MLAVTFQFGRADKGAEVVIGDRGEVEVVSGGVHLKTSTFCNKLSANIVF